MISPPLTTSQQSVQKNKKTPKIAILKPIPISLLVYAYICLLVNHPYAGIGVESKSFQDSTKNKKHKNRQSYRRSKTPLLVRHHLDALLTGSSFEFPGEDLVEQVGQIGRGGGNNFASSIALHDTNDRRKFKEVSKGRYHSRRRRPINIGTTSSSSEALRGKILHPVSSASGWNDSEQYHINDFSPQTIMASNTITLNYLGIKEKILHRLNGSEQKDGGHTSVDPGESEYDESSSFEEEYNLYPSSPIATPEEPQQGLPPQGEGIFIKILSDDRGISDIESDFSVNDGDKVSSPEHAINSSNKSPTPIQRPVVYRYFGRARTKPDSVPLILLGPCADHWKDTGNVLASRGYNVMACEEVHEESSSSTSLSTPSDDPVQRKGDGLVLAILEALRWKRAVIVGCEKNARAAIEAAMTLSFDRVAGLILCGDLTEAINFIKEWNERQVSLSPELQRYYFSIEEFLADQVSCPYTVITDCDGGDAMEAFDSLSKQEEQHFQQHHRQNSAHAQMINTGLHTMSTNNRYPRPRESKPLRTTIVGGGSSPHRRLPEQFAWVLSRFIEESVVTDDYPISSSFPENAHRQSQSRYNPINAYSSNRIFSPGSLLVTGRVVASSILYLSAASVFLYQYQNLQFGLSGLRSYFCNATQCKRLARGMEWLIKVLISEEFVARRSQRIQLQQDRSRRTENEFDSIDKDNSQKIQEEKNGNKNHRSSKNRRRKLFQRRSKQIPVEEKQEDNLTENDNNNFDMDKESKLNADQENEISPILPEPPSTPTPEEKNDDKIPSPPDQEFDHGRSLDRMFHILGLDYVTS